MSSVMSNIQSIGRGIRHQPLDIVMLKRNVGKTLIMDYESASFGTYYLNYYAEFRDDKTGDTYWKKFSNFARLAIFRKAITVIRKNSDGSHEYIKNSKEGINRKLSEEEIMWLMVRI